MADIIPNFPEPASPLPAPFFHDARHHIKIYQGDCLEILAAIPADCVDLIFADPPFNIGYKYDIYQDRKAYDEYYQWTQRWMAAWRSSGEAHGR